MLQCAKQLGINKIPEIARIEAQKLGLPEDICQDYLTNHIFYDLGGAEIAGMTKFYDLAVKHDLAVPGMAAEFV